MASYLLLYKGGKAPEGEAAQQKSMEDWGKWFKDLGGAVQEIGNPCHAGKSVNNDGVTDNAEATAISGYSVIEADNIDKAVELAKTSPMLGDGGTVEVHETFDVM